MGFFDEAKKLLNSYKTQQPQQPQQPIPQQIQVQQTQTKKPSSVTDPIKGYTLKYHYHDVEITSWEYIQRDIQIGNRIVCMQEPTNEADDKAVMLMFVPQRKKLGYLYRGKIQDMVNDYINRGDKVVARLSYLTFKPEFCVKIDIAFFKKNKTK